MKFRSNKLSTVFRLLGVAAIVALTAQAIASDEQQTQRNPKSWTPATLRVALEQMPEGEPLNGRKLHQSLMCASCHGAQGIAPTGNWPSLAGQRADYTYKMLLDYRSGLRNEDRRSELMTTVAAMMDKQDMADVAAFYATLQPQQLKIAGATDKQPETVDPAESLVRKGDPERLITPCASCHGVRGQGGKKASAALTGQKPKAFIRTMQLYKSGQRGNDVNQVMSQIARKLSAEEIRLLAEYYYTLNSEDHHAQ